MARNIGQVRFYGTSNSKNSPNGLKMSQLASGGIFPDNIKQLSIQGYPGTMFYINKNINPVILGASGVYHFELDGSTKISHLRFDPKSINEINTSSAENAYLIIDYIYET